MFGGNFDTADVEGFDGLEVAIAVAIEGSRLYYSLMGRCDKGEALEESLLEDKHDSSSKASF